MRSAEDVTAAGSQAVDDHFDLVSDCSWRAEGHSALNGDAAVESQAVAEVGFQLARLHCFCFGLQRLQDVQTALQHERDEGAH